MLASRKTIAQKQEIKTRTSQIKKTLKKMHNGLSNQHQHDDYDMNKSQDSQFNGKAN